MDSSPKALRVGVCVPTIRDEQAREFVAAWAPAWCASAPDGPQVSLFLHEDSDEKHVQLEAYAGLEITHTSRADIAPALGEAEWIIPRASGACRSFPMWLAWRAGVDYVLTMDDDCLPLDTQHAATFIAEHLAAFEQDRWFRTIHGSFPRGIPYGDRGRLPVGLNHGLWAEIPDLDGPTALVEQRAQKDAVTLPSRQVIPPGMSFPLCAMNVCYHRSVIPAAYNLLMGLESVGFDRFDDIWSGLLIKRVFDHLGLYAVSGEPLVRHAKASDFFVNLRKEALGIHLNEFFWQHVTACEFGDAATVGDCYRVLAEHVARFPSAFPQSPAPAGYFERLGEAMRLWSELFAEASSGVGSRDESLLGEGSRDEGSLGGVPSGKSSSGETSRGDRWRGKAPSGEVRPSRMTPPETEQGSAGS